MPDATPAPAEALSLLLDRYTDAYHAFGEAMDAREWPDDSPLPIMTDWQRARRDQFNAARIALEKALPDLVRERAVLLARAEAAEARVRELELAEVTVASELTAIHEEMRAVLMWSTTLHNDEAQRIRRWQVTLRKTLGLKTGTTPRLPCDTDVIYRGRKGKGPGRIMNHEWNDAATETIGYLIARPGDEEYPDCWESVGLSAVTALAGSPS